MTIVAFGAVTCSLKSGVTPGARTDDLCELASLKLGAVLAGLPSNPDDSTLELEVTGGSGTGEEYRHSLRNLLVGPCMRERNTTVGFFVVLEQTSSEAVSPDFDVLQISVRRRPSSDNPRGATSRATSVDPGPQLGVSDGKTACRPSPARPHQCGKAVTAPSMVSAAPLT